MQEELNFYFKKFNIEDIDLWSHGLAKQCDKEIGRAHV